MAAADLVATLLDRLERLVQRDLEVGQLGVDVVVGLAAHALGLGVRIGADGVGLGLGGAVDLVLGHELAGVLAGSGDDLGRLGVGCVDDLLAAGEEVVGLGERVGQHRSCVVEQVEDVRAVDHARGRHRHRSCVLDDAGELVELVVDVHVVPFVRRPSGVLPAAR